MLAKVAIVGRPNVGKSSLLNMVAGRRVSIVDPTAGVTRDRVSTELELPPLKKDGPARWCEIVDTGGFGIYSSDDTVNPLTADVERQIQFAVGEAEVIFFVVDAHDGVTPLDEQVARLLRKRAEHQKVILIANKVDSSRFESVTYEMMRLGFGEPLRVSATTQRGKRELLELLNDRLGEAGEATDHVETEMKLAIVGKRNAGKSTLVNALAGSERVIASEVAGTTRDSVDVRFELEGRSFTAIDTAGVRKRKSVDGDIEYYSLHRALRAVRRADVVMLLIDATVAVSQVDKKLGQEINEHFKPCVIVVNKWDLVADDLTPEDYLEHLSGQLKGLDYCPIVFVSAKERERIQDAILTACDLFEQAGERVGTGELNRIMQEILTRRGPSSKLGKVAKIYYVTQPAVHPPTIAMFVNNPDLFDHNYQRYLMNQVRANLPFKEVPIKLLIRARKRRDLDAEVEI
ncbi:MAG: ribosome biogenesis GTPase Der [Phycisphaeraceae bacterium]